MFKMWYGLNVPRKFLMASFYLAIEKAYYMGWLKKATWDHKQLYYIIFPGCTVGDLLFYFVDYQMSWKTKFFFLKFIYFKLKWFCYKTQETWVYSLSDRGLFITLKPGFAKDFSFAKLYKNYPNLTVGFPALKNKW